MIIQMVDTSLKNQETERKSV